jgi:hypothetical protein
MVGGVGFRCIPGQEATNGGRVPSAAARRADPAIIWFRRITRASGQREPASLGIGRANEPASPMRYPCSSSIDNGLGQVSCIKVGHQLSNLSSFVRSRLPRVRNAL